MNVSVSNQGIRISPFPHHKGSSAALKEADGIPYLRTNRDKPYVTFTRDSKPPVCQTVVYAFAVRSTSWWQDEAGLICSLVALILAKLRLHLLVHGPRILGVPIVSNDCSGIRVPNTCSVPACMLAGLFL